MSKYISDKKILSIIQMIDMGVADDKIAGFLDVSKTSVYRYKMIASFVRQGKFDEAEQFTTSSGERTYDRINKVCELLNIAYVKPCDIIPKIPMNDTNTATAVVKIIELLDSINNKLEELTSSLK